MCDQVQMYDHKLRFEVINKAQWTIYLLRKVVSLFYSFNHLLVCVSFFVFHVENSQTTMPLNAFLVLL